MNQKELKALNYRINNIYENMFDNGYCVLVSKGKKNILFAHFYTYNDMQNTPGTDVEQTGKFEYALYSDELNELINNTELFLTNVLRDEIPSMNTVSQ